ncbi:rCG61941 [Rattus norvegicus]|uniref:RCG61941 n=1 Tax=Rattus norvegicus TaxID=10116 RepID=A6HBT5_RAT|nr:rCG61941 [Rattus norvegicus]
MKSRKRRRAGYRMAREEREVGIGVCSPLTGNGCLQSPC